MHVYMLWRQQVMLNRKGSQKQLKDDGSTNMWSFLEAGVDDGIETFGTVVHVRKYAAFVFQV